MRRTARAAAEQKFSAANMSREMIEVFCRLCPDQTPAMRS
jgi:hypothetical protein